MSFVSFEERCAALPHEILTPLGLIKGHKRKAPDSILESGDKGNIGVVLL